MSTITTATALPAAADSRTSSVDSTSSTSTKATSLCSADELLIRATKKDQGIEVVVTETHPALEGDAVTLKGKGDGGEQGLQQKPTNTPMRNPEGWQEVYRIRHDFERTLEGGVKISLKRDELVEVQLGAGGGGSSEFPFLLFASFSKHIRFSSSLYIPVGRRMDPNTQTAVQLDLWADLCRLRDCPRVGAIGKILRRGGFYITWDRQESLELDLRLQCLARFVPEAFETCAMNAFG